MAIPTIILADDDEDDRLFTCQALRRLPYVKTIIEVSDGEQLVGLLTKWSVATPSEPIGLIILDMNMAGLSGMQALTIIKAHTDLRLIPVVMLSTADDADLVKLAYQTGVNCFMKKPASYADLDSIAQAIHRCFLAVRRF